MLDANSDNDVNNGYERAGSNAQKNNNRSNFRSYNRRQNNGRNNINERNSYQSTIQLNEYNNFGNDEIHSNNFNDTTGNTFNQTSTSSYHQNRQNYNRNNRYDRQPNENLPNYSNRNRVRDIHYTNKNNIINRVKPLVSNFSDNYNSYVRTDSQLETFSNHTDESINNRNTYSTSNLTKKDQTYPKKYNDDRNRNYNKTSNLIKHKKTKAPTKEDLCHREILTDSLKRNKCECSICMINLRKDSQMWSCNKCYNIFHLTCIKQWSSKTLESNAEWSCPVCKTLYTNLSDDLKYYCFCGKRRNPDNVSKIWDSIPHCCEDICGKDLPNCQHKCTSYCHPGACPACSASKNTKCGCGKVENVFVKCGLTFQCTSQCGKLLNCRRHTCQMVCHQGDCGNCEETFSKVCYCHESDNGDHIQVNCSSIGLDEELDAKISCGKPCNKQKSCGNHKCTRICHKEDCSKELCELSPKIMKECVCGAVKCDETQQRLSCLDPQFKCESVCNHYLNCQVHKCREKCCGLSASSHICPKKCNRPLSCGVHLCEANCSEHYTIGIARNNTSISRKYQCPPCLVVSFDELPCECGAKVILPPIKCGVRPPVCSNICSREHSCDHPVVHRCHSEETCPPCIHLTDKLCPSHNMTVSNIPCNFVDPSCGRVCGKSLPDCTHVCQQICHKGPCLAPHEVCQQKCAQIRQDCGLHQCNVTCHPSQSDCTQLYSAKCEVFQRIYCKCNMSHDNVTCTLLQKYKSNPSVNPTSINLLIDPEDGSVLIECNARCQQAENRSLAFFKFTNTKFARDIFYKYNKHYFREFCRNNLMYVKSMETLFHDIVQSSVTNPSKRVLHDITVEKSKFLQRYSVLYNVQCITSEISWRQTCTVALTAHPEKSVITKINLTEHVEDNNFRIIIR